MHQRPNSKKAAKQLGLPMLAFKNERNLDRAFAAHWDISTQRASSKPGSDSSVQTPRVLPPRGSSGLVAKEIFYQKLILPEGHGVLALLERAQRQLATGQPVEKRFFDQVMRVASVTLRLLPKEVVAKLEHKSDKPKTEGQPEEQIAQYNAGIEALDESNCSAREFEAGQSGMHHKLAGGLVEPDRTGGGFSSRRLLPLQFPSWLRTDPLERAQPSGRAALVEKQVA